MHLLNTTHNSTAAVLIGPTLIADRERMLGSDHPDTLVSRNNLAAYAAMARRNEADAQSSGQQSSGTAAAKDR